MMINSNAKTSMDVLGVNSLPTSKFPLPFICRRSANRTFWGFLAGDASSPAGLYEWKLWAIFNSPAWDNDPLLSSNHGFDAVLYAFSVVGVLIMAADLHGVLFSDGKGLLKMELH